MSEPFDAEAFNKSAPARFLRDRSGNVAMLWALMGATLLSLVGLATDFARAQTLRAEMQNAADGAALVAERSSTKPLADRTTAARAYFDQTLGSPGLTNDIQFEVFEETNGGHRVDAQIDLELGLARLIRNTDWTIRVTAHSVSQASPPIEVALALDNTGSMQNDMQTLRDGAEDLAEFLLQIDGDDISVAVVPFVAQVNIGNGAAQLAWMDTAGNNPHHGEIFEDKYMGYRGVHNNACTDATRFPASYGGFPIRWIRGSAATPGYTDTSRCYAFSPSDVNIFSIYNNLPTNARWGGCVEARPEPYDVTDAAPNVGTPATMFTPFFSLDDGGNVSGPVNNWITSSTYDRDNMLGLSGSPTWYANTAANSHVRTLGPYKYRSGVPVSVTTGSNGRGPNRGCPTSSPIVPLTTDEGVVINAIRDMIYWNGGGTNQAEGLAWAWRTLSPGAPFTEGRPYNDPDDPVRKVIVLFTDGANTSLDNNNAALESDYAAVAYRRIWTSYQYDTQPSAGSPGLTSTWRRTGITGMNSMVTYINNRQRTLCTNIKATGIEIYTIGFRISAGSTAEQLLQFCATDSEHYFRADSQGELLQAFAAIGTGIGDLRITR
ncbi:MAG: Tad domain-containing protein [Hyphomonadaceae bacterium]|nr:Tad domain-containing protein [Hyphomonadaceae bacterium]